MKKARIAILDDYQGVALTSADWAPLLDQCELTVFHDHIGNLDALITRLQPFEVVCVMRERTPLPRSVLQNLPNLRLIASTGARNASIDTEAADALGIQIAHTGYSPTAAIELTWALLLAAARHIPREVRSVRSGGWQTQLGVELQGKTLGLLGLGRIGSSVAAIARAFGMRVVAWSHNLTQERAERFGCQQVSKEDLFQSADFVSLHLILSHRTRGLIGKADFDVMKPSAWFINTARADIVDQSALLDCLTSRKIAGAALDVFWQEPLPSGSPWRTLKNVLATPHIGFVSEEAYQAFFQDIVANIARYLQHGTSRT